jgi:hypothetical protein
MWNWLVAGGIAGSKPKLWPESDPMTVRKLEPVTKSFERDIRKSHLTGRLWFTGEVDGALLLMDSTNRRRALQRGGFVLPEMLAFCLKPGT